MSLLRMLRDYPVVTCLVKYAKGALLGPSRHEGAQYCTSMVGAVEPGQSWSFGRCVCNRIDAAPTARIFCRWPSMSAPQERRRLRVLFLISHRV